MAAETGDGLPRPQGQAGRGLRAPLGAGTYIEVRSVLGLGALRPGGPSSTPTC